MRTICARSVSPPTRSARTTTVPVPLTVPPVTLSPTDFSTGTGSPVTIDSSIDVWPSVTTASTGTFSPGRTPDQIAYGDLRERNVLLDIVTNATSGLRCKTEQPSDCGAGAAPRPQLQHLPEQHKNRHHHSRIEIRLDHAAHEKTRRKELRGERSQRRIDVRGAYAERDQGEHVGTSVSDRRPSPLEEGPARPPDHRRGQCEPQPVRPARIDETAPRPGRRPCPPWPSA